MSGPAECVESLHHCSAECASKVRATDTPVEARQTHRPPALLQRVEVDLEILTEALALLCQNELSVGSSHEIALKQAVENKYSQVTREMVITHARFS
jgi:hypothetical protein